MFVEIPQNLILVPLAAFLIGWILSSINSRLGSKYRARRRDPRDDRIRQLEAELRIAQSELESTKGNLLEQTQALDLAREDIEKRDNVISHQQGKVEALKKDLKDSVLKTRELRAELSTRAEENLRSEVKLREVETELSVAQASTDMIATGVLDYSLAPDRRQDEEDEDLPELTSDEPETSAQQS